MTDSARPSAAEASLRHRIGRGAEMGLTPLEEAALRTVHAHARYAALRSVRPWFRFPWRRVERAGRDTIRQWQEADADFERLNGGG